MTPKKFCLLDTTGLIHIETHRDYDSIYKHCTGSNQTKFLQKRRETGYKALPLVKKIFVINVFWERENRFSPTSV